MTVLLLLSAGGAVTGAIGGMKACASVFPVPQLYIPCVCSFALLGAVSGGIGAAVSAGVEQALEGSNKKTNGQGSGTAGAVVGGAAGSLTTLAADSLASAAAKKCLSSDEFKKGLFYMLLK